MKTRRRRSLRMCTGFCAALLCALTLAPGAQAQDATTLQARHAMLRDTLEHNAFGRPLVLESIETAGALKGDVYARIDLPFARLAPALLGSEHWCEILILHLNVKQCSAGPGTAAPTLALVVGDKLDRPSQAPYRIEFGYRLVQSVPGYQQVVLQAETGPLGTSQYRIVVEAAALDGTSTFLHLSYAYEQGLAARLAMQVYLATLGRAKVGFSIVGRQADGTPTYVGDLRGVIERNTMRYYLAIEAYLGALDTPPALQLAKRLNDWHTSVERYPLQLHELERSEYLRLKQGDAQAEPLPGG